MTKLKALRQAKKLTIAGVAEKTGLSIRQVWNLENGLYSLKLPVAITMAKLYSVNPEDLLEPAEEQDE